MNIEESLANFPNQFSYEPEIINAENFKLKPKIIVAGMGGSHLAASLLKAYDPYLPILIHWDTGLPHIPTDDWENYCLIASSYSGNTSETISALTEARALGLPVAILSAGGQLIDLAQKNSLPYVKMPDPTLPPREALGFSLHGLLALLGKKEMLDETKALRQTLLPNSFKEVGKELAHKIYGSIPIIYSSRKNSALAYIWKIKFNETSKIPAFYNIFPELNHNEIESFATTSQAKTTGVNFQFIFITDEEDSGTIRQEMLTTKKIFEDQNLTVNTIPLIGINRWERLFNNILLAGWTAYYLAIENQVDPLAVPMIDKLKKDLAEN